MQILRDKGLSYGDIGKLFGISRQRAEQIVSRAGKPQVWRNNEWFKDLKALILQRDKHCQKCGATEKLVVHHIDKDKSNNSLNNLITLCNKCHLALHHITVEDVSIRGNKMMHNKRAIRKQIMEIQNGSALSG